MAAKVKKAVRTRPARQTVGEEASPKVKVDRKPALETKFAQSVQAQKAAAERQEFEQRMRDEQVAAFRDRKETAKEVRAERESKRPQRAPVELKKFVLLSGSHTDENGIKHIYDKDAVTVVQSEFNLDARFMGKFRRVGGETAAGIDYQDVVDRPGLLDPPFAVRRPHGQKTSFTTDTDEKAQEQLAKAREEEGGEENEVFGEPFTDDEEATEEEETNS